MQASDVMTQPVVSVEPGTPLRAVVELLLQHRISGVPVVENGEVLGFVGDGDLLHRYEIGTDEVADARSWWQRLMQDDPAPLAYVRSHGGHARDVMNRHVVTVAENTPLAKLAQIFEARHVRRVPVLRAGRMVGLVTRADLVRALAAMCVHTQPPAPPAPVDDERIRTQLVAELSRQPWWSNAWSNVVVHQGVVQFVGFVPRHADKEAARVAAENIPGVRGVEDDRRLEAELPQMF